MKRKARISRLLAATSTAMPLASFMKKVCTVVLEAVDDVKDIKSEVQRLATFVVEDGAR